MKKIIIITLFVFVAVASTTSAYAGGGQNTGSRILAV